MELLVRFKAALAAHPWQVWPALPGRRNNLQAGVLVPVMPGEEWTCILTLRPGKLRRHGGEICFPGGKPEPCDTSLEATALREAREELGLEDVKLVGRLSSIPLFTSEFRLEPFVGLVSDARLQPDPQEVEAVLPASLTQALELQAIDAVPFQLGDQRLLSPVFDPKDLMERPPTAQPIFGATAHGLYELVRLFAAAAGRPAPPLRESSRSHPVG